ncbi:MAG: hypothetical protein Q4G03_06755 [Planctomycetia bacterium]|nr:hypothetical protein [Planctomycetia bacterium]
MSKRKMRFFLALAWFFLSCMSAALAQNIAIDSVFPDTTQIFISVSNVKDLSDHWQQTALYATLAAPQYQEFRDSIRQQIETAWPNRLGLNLQDFTTLPSGEIAGGLIAQPGKKPGFAVMMNVDGNAAEVNEFLMRLIRKTTENQRGSAAKERIVIGRQSVEATALSFPDKETGVVRTAYYVALPQLLIAADQKYLVELLLGRLAGEKLNPLANRPEYQAILARCAQDAKSTARPQIKFFLNPLAAGEAIRSLVPQDQLKGQSPFMVLAKQGFGGVAGVGGTIDFATESYECVYRVKVYIPQPMTRALKTLSFTNVDALVHPQWIGANATRYTLLSFNPLVTFNNVGPLFDEFVETEGAWNDVIDSFEKDKLGPQVNLRADLFANFGRQISSTNAFDPEKVSDGEKFVFALNIIEGKEQATAEALRKMFEPDPDVTQITLAGAEFWQYSPQKGGRATRPTGVRPIRSTRPSATRPTAESIAASDAPEAELIKGSVFGVAKGALYVSNDAQYLQKKLAETANPNDSILNQPEHKIAIQRLAQEPAIVNGLFLLGYARNIDGLRENYELFRRGMIPQGKTLSARLLNAALAPADQQGARTAKFDGSTLPPFDESIVQNIGFSLLFGVVENDGFFLKGFSVNPAK